MAGRVSVTHEDLIELDKQIRLKETGLPGSLSKNSPRSGANRLQKLGSNSPLAANAKRSIHHPRDSMKGLLDDPKMAADS